MSGIYVCRGPKMEETARTSTGERWCFKCRTRAEFSWVVMWPVIDWNDENSISAAMWGEYEHSECGNCKQHAGELFQAGHTPTTEREGGPGDSTSGTATPDNQPTKRKKYLMPSTKDSPPKFTNPQLDALATIWSPDGQLAHVKSSDMLAEIVQGDRVMAYMDRYWMASEIDRQIMVLRRLHNEVTTCRTHTECEDDADWPKDYPLHSVGVDAFRALSDATLALERGIQVTKQQYRERVLTWLLAEVKA